MEGLADDDARHPAPAHVQRGEPVQVLRRADPARGDEGQFAAVEDRGQGGEVGTGEGAVGGHRRDHHGVGAGAGEAVEHGRQVDAAALLPAPHHDLGPLHVEAHRHPVPPAGEPAHEPGILDGGGADHHPGHAAVEQAQRRRLVPDAAPRLDGDAHGGGDGQHHGEVPGPAGAGGVEVDDVDPGGAGGLERDGDGHGIDVVGRLAVEVALRQPDAAAVADVDRGEELRHAAASQST